MNKNVVSTLAVTLLVCLTISSVADAYCWRHCYLACRYCGWWTSRRCCGLYVYCHYHCSGKRSADLLEGDVLKGDVLEGDVRREKRDDDYEIPCSTLKKVFNDCLHVGEPAGMACFNFDRVSQCLKDPGADDDLEVAFKQADVKIPCRCLDKSEFLDLCYHGQDEPYMHTYSHMDQCMHAHGRYGHFKY